ncbi:Two component system histidine kinase, PAS and HAMP domains-containing [Desulfonema magnum]|uniref:histidine kinase n=1 Tax=Desulfonema magnum TaxID=45655 RepID=A0A975BG59_9BACT|nr:Two component system histidine kinase, PAS and HAMP domains-containing [Desulfonema magnum]
MIIFYISYISINAKSIEDDLQEQLLRASALAKESLPSALWQYHYEYTNDFINSLFLFKDIVFVSIMSEDTTITAKTHPDFKKKDFLYFKNSSDFITDETVIRYENNNVGKIRIAMTRVRINDMILSQSISAFSLLLVIFAAIFSTVLKLSGKYIFSPLLKLENSAKLISDGNFDIHIDTSSKDEIGQLAETFSRMIHNLKSVTASRDELNYEIMERKKAEKKLVREKEKAQHYLDIAGVIFIVINADQTVSLINKKGCEVFGYEESEILGKNWFDHFIPENDRKKTVAEFFRLITGEVEHIEYFENYVMTKNNDNRLIAWHNVVLRDEKGKVTSTLSSGEDITEQRKIAQNLRSSLKEKEILLRELYHRTKNNMQIICSMLAMQAISIKDENFKKILSETENRIKSMALVHQKLYQAKDLSKINLKDYVADLVFLLFKSYGVSEKKVSVFTDIEDVIVLIDTAIPCGLILNELITNSIKYAFQDREGEIRLHICKTETNEINMIFSDNGVGFPDNYDLEKANTLGIRSIYMITEHQLGGKVDLKTDNGVSYHIKFKDILYDQRV